MPIADFEPYKIFEFGKIEFSQADLDRIPPRHLIFLGQSGLAANDISVFLKLLIGHMGQEAKAGPLMDLSVLSLVIIQRNLQSKLFEFINLCDEYHKTCSRKKDEVVGHMLEEIKEDLDEIKLDPCYAFSEFVRDKVTNHYAYRDWHSGAKEHKADHKFKIYMHQMNGNTFYPFAEEASHLSALSNPKWGDIEVNDVIRWMSDTNHTLIHIQQQVALAIFKAFIPNFRMTSELVYVPNRLIFDEETRYPLLALQNGSGRWTV